VEAGNGITSQGAELDHWIILTASWNEKKNAESSLAFRQDMVNHRFFSKALDTLPKALEEGLL
jgi:hypothetical protein